MQPPAASANTDLGNLALFTDLALACALDHVLTSLENLRGRGAMQEATPVSPNKPLLEEALLP